MRGKTVVRRGSETRNGGECPSWNCHNPAANCKGSWAVHHCSSLWKHPAYVTRCNSPEIARHGRSVGVRRGSALLKSQFHRIECYGSGGKEDSAGPPLRCRARAGECCCNN